jgi:hypothetical protein
VGEIDMAVRRRAGTGVLLALAVLVVPSTAQAVEVTVRDGGVVRVTGTESADHISITRDDDGALHVIDAASTIDIAEFSSVDVRLGAGNDVLDTHLVRGVPLRLDGGPGADRLIVGAEALTRIVDTTATDTVDLSLVDGGVEVRWQRSRRRIAATCIDCASPSVVVFPARPGTVVLGDDDEDVDLAGWRVRGRTAWKLGDGRNRFFGSPVRRSVVDGGVDTDQLVSWAAVDVLRGGRGADRIADFGGTGDVLQGGAGIDVVASLDGRRDRVDGGTGRDMCPSLTRSASGCDTSRTARSFDLVTYLPTTAWRTVLRVVGIRR